MITERKAYEWMMKLFDYIADPAPGDGYTDDEISQLQTWVEDACNAYYVPTIGLTRPWSKGFVQALEYWKAFGGGMRWCPASEQCPYETWEQVPQFDHDLSKEDTIEALRRGGLSEEQIEQEMATWVDAAENA